MSTEESKELHPLVVRAAAATAAATAGSSRRDSSRERDEPRDDGRDEVRDVREDGRVGCHRGRRDGRVPEPPFEPSGFGEVEAEAPTLRRGRRFDEDAEEAGLRRWPKVRVAIGEMRVLVAL